MTVAGSGSGDGVADGIIVASMDKSKNTYFDRDGVPEQRWTETAISLSVDSNTPVGTSNWYWYVSTSGSMHDAADDVPVTVPVALAMFARPISTPFNQTTAPSMALTVMDAFNSPVEGKLVVNCWEETAAESKKY
jgi:hypothetical protein